MKDSNLTAKRTNDSLRLPEDLHKRLRVKAAEEDATLQDWVAMAIGNELDRQGSEKDKAL